MNSPMGPPWQPTFEMLAAYADGEFDSRPECAARKQQLEDWLASNPDAMAALQAQREVNRLMAQSKPEEPSAAQWAKVWDGIQKQPLPKQRQRTRVPWYVAAGGLAAAVLVGVGVMTNWFGAASEQAKLDEPIRPSITVIAQVQESTVKKPPELVVVGTYPGKVLEILPVATADDVEIIHAMGPMRGTMLVGRLPLSGPMVLLTPNEVEVQTPTAGPSGTSLRITSDSVPMMWVPPAGNKDQDDQKQ